MMIFIVNHYFSKDRHTHTQKINSFCYVNNGSVTINFFKSISYLPLLFIRSDKHHPSKNISRIIKRRTIIIRTITPDLDHWTKIISHIPFTLYYSGGLNPMFADTVGERWNETDHHERRRERTHETTSFHSTTFNWISFRVHSFLIFFGGYTSNTP